MYNLADAINEVTEETGKTTRYGDPQVIASDLEKYVYGTVAYVQEELAAKGLEEKTVAVVTYVNEDGTYTVADSLQTADLQSGTGRLERMEEYVMCVSTSLTDRYHTEMEQTETDLISGLQTTSTVKVVTLDELMQADAIVAFGRSTLRQDLLDSFGDRAYDGIIITSEPDCIYGINMQAVENAMGYAYIIASIYCDELDIDPVEMCAYFYEKFLHITDRESLEQVVRTNFSETILPQGVVPTLASDYSAAKVEAKLTRGMNYYLAHKADFQNEEYAYVGIDTWTPDLSSGIGSTSAYYSDAVEWAVENGITTGTGDGTTFSPDLACTRAQAVTFLWRAARLPGSQVCQQPIHGCFRRYLLL